MSLGGLRWALSRCADGRWRRAPWVLLYLVVDYHSTHHTKAVRWLSRHEATGASSWVFLPVYAPSSSPTSCSAASDVRSYVRPLPPVRLAEALGVVVAHGMDLSSTLSHLRLRATVLAAVAATGALFAAGLATAATQASPAGDTYPAKLQVLRAGVSDGRLDVLAEITQRSNGDRVRVSFIANGRRSAFTAPVEDGRIRFKRRLPASQRHMSTGIMEISYEGNDRVRPTEVRLRAANGKARLQRDVLSLHDGVITAHGSLADSAGGVVRLILSYERPNGSVGEWQGRASIRDDGSWRLEETLPPDARDGGYLSMQYTGYHPRRVRGEQLAKELLDGQSFGIAAQTKRNKKTTPAPVVDSPPAPEPAPTPEPAPAPAPAPAPEPAPAPAPSPVAITAWRPPGAAPLSDAEAASRVRPAAEVRPANAVENAYRPSAAELDTFRNGHVDRYGRTAVQYNPLTAYVTGGFSGTTDEILQWVAHKWGIPEDTVRAVAVNESSWRMSQLGDRKTVSDPSRYPAQSRIAGTSDVYQSLGIMQVRWNPEGNQHQGTESLRWKSTAFNADYWGAVVRYYYDGLCSWCSSGYSAGQDWASIGAWYNPSPWNSSQTYVEAAKTHIARQTWAQPGF